jgi:uncharacterized membrane protein YgcG
MSVMNVFRFTLLVVFLLISLSAKSEYFVINRYDVDIIVKGSQGVFEVRETIEVDFSQPRRGIFRDINTRYKMNGEYYDIKIYGIDVNNKFKTEKGSNGIRIRIGHPDQFVSGIQTYEISYKVEKAFIFAEDRTEFYWNLVGNQWQVPIHSITYSVTLDESLPMAENDYFIYTGQRGQQGSDATIEYFMGQFKGQSTRSYQPGEGLTLAINLPIEYIKRPGKWELWMEKYGKLSLGAILFIIISGLFYRTWRKYGKDYPIVRMVYYTPPKDLTPAEAGMIIDEKADNVDILSLLPYWAHNGHITISEIPVSKRKNDYELRLLKPLGADAAPFESIVFDALFKGRNSVKVSALKEKFYEHLKSAKVSLKSHVQNSGVYYPVSIKMQLTAFIMAFLTGMAAIGLGLILESLALGLLLGLSSMVGFFFAHYMLKKNQKGVQLYQEILGFKMFVKAAEKDRLERLLKEDPDYFEKTLPYAMIFGYARQWSAKFDGLLMEPPQWYVTPHGYYHGAFMPSKFGESFEHGISDIQSVFSSVPAPSGGSGGGFGGGGFSGGGFGGGGGGSW